MVSQSTPWPGRSSSLDGCPAAAAAPAVVELEIERPAWGDLLRAVRCSQLARRVVQICMTCSHPTRTALAQRRDVAK